MIILGLGFINLVNNERGGWVRDEGAARIVIFDGSEMDDEHLFVMYTVICGTTGSLKGMDRFE